MSTSQVTQPQVTQPQVTQPQVTQPLPTQPLPTQPFPTQPFPNTVYSEVSQPLPNTFYSEVSQEHCKQSSVGRQIFSIFHSLMAIIAIYMSYRCNNGFHLGSFLIACTCPYIYIMYMVATRGTCGILEPATASSSQTSSSVSTKKK